MSTHPFQAGIPSTEKELPVFDELHLLDDQSTLDVVLLLEACHYQGEHTTSRSLKEATDATESWGKISEDRRVLFTDWNLQDGTSLELIIEMLEKRDFRVPVVVLSTAVDYESNPRPMLLSALVKALGQERYSQYVETGLLQFFSKSNLTYGEKEMEDVLRKIESGFASGFHTKSQ